MIQRYDTTVSLLITYHHHAKSSSKYSLDRPEILRDRRWEDPSSCHAGSAESVAAGTPNVRDGRLTIGDNCAA